MSILNAIHAQLPSMTDADREIGKFILEDPEKMVALSSAALAQATGRSQSSVVKFSQKMGFAGYGQLKLAVTRAKAQEWQIPDGMIHATIEKSDSYVVMSQKLLAAKIDAMQQTVQANAPDQVETAVEAMSGARRIHLTGVGASSLVAQDFSYKLMKLGLVAFLDRDSHVQIANASAMSSDDLMIAISQSGHSLETMKVAEIAKARGARLISITGLAQNPIAEMADIRLFTVANEEKMRSSAITSRDAQLAMADLLFLSLVQKQEDAQDFILNSETAVAILKA